MSSGGGGDVAPGPGPPNTIQCLYCRATIYFPGLPANRYMNHLFTEHNIMYEVQSVINKTLAMQQPKNYPELVENDAPDSSNRVTSPASSSVVPSPAPASLPPTMSEKGTQTEAVQCNSIEIQVDISTSNNEEKVLFASEQISMAKLRTRRLSSCSVKSSTASTQLVTRQSQSKEQNGIKAEVKSEAKATERSDLRASTDYVIEGNPQDLFTKSPVVEIDKANVKLHSRTDRAKLEIKKMLERAAKVPSHRGKKKLPTCELCGAKYKRLHKLKVHLMKQHLKELTKSCKEYQPPERKSSRIELKKEEGEQKKVTSSSKKDEDKRRGVEERRRPAEDTNLTGIIKRSKRAEDDNEADSVDEIPESLRLSPEEAWTEGCQYFCMLCSRNFCSFGVYKHHIGDYHGMLIEEYRAKFGRHGEVLNRLTCIICNNEMIHKHSSIKQHLKINHNITIAKYKEQADKLTKEKGELEKDSPAPDSNGRKSPDPLSADLEVMPLPPASQMSPCLKPDISSSKPDLKAVSKTEPKEADVKKEEEEEADEKQMEVDDHPEVEAGSQRRRWYEGCDYRCLVCGKNYDIYFSYHGHMKKVHNMSLEQYHAQYGSDAEINRYYTCKICKLDIVWRLFNIRKHMESVHSLTLDQYGQLHEPSDSASQTAAKETAGGEIGTRTRQANQEDASANQRPWFEGCSFTCLVAGCKKVFRVHSDYVDHLSSHHSMSLDAYHSSYGTSGEVYEKYECRVCSVSLTHKMKNISSHLALVHDMSLQEYEDMYIPEDRKHVSSTDKSTHEAMAMDSLEHNGENGLVNSNANQEEIPDEDEEPYHFTESDVILEDPDEAEANEEESQPARSVEANGKGEGDQPEETENVKDGGASNGSSTAEHAWYHGSNLTCKICHKNFANDQWYFHHFSKVHRITKEQYNEKYGKDAEIYHQYECLICHGQIRWKYSSIRQHLKQMHNMIIQDYEAKYLDVEPCDITDDTANDGDIIIRSPVNTPDPISALQEKAMNPCHEVTSPAAVAGVLAGTGGKSVNTSFAKPIPSVGVVGSPLSPNGLVVGQVVADTAIAGGKMANLGNSDQKLVVASVASLFPPPPPLKASPAAVAAGLRVSAANGTGPQLSIVGTTSLAAPTLIGIPSTVSMAVPGMPPVAGVTSTFAGVPSSINGGVAVFGQMSPYPPAPASSQSSKGAALTFETKPDSQWYHGSDLICLVCEKQFVDFTYYCTHIRTNHQMSKEEYNQKYGTNKEYFRLYTCLVCGLKMKWTYQSISGHLKSHNITIKEYEAKYDVTSNQCTESGKLSDLVMNAKGGVVINSTTANSTPTKDTVSSAKPEASTNLSLNGSSAPMVKIETLDLDGELKTNGGLLTPKTEEVAKLPTLQPISVDRLSRGSFGKDGSEAGSPVKSPEASGGRWYNQCKFTCKACLEEKYFTVPQALRMHLNGIHGLTRKDYEARYGNAETITKYWTCRICNKELKCQKGIIIQHLLNVHAMELIDYERKYVKPSEQVVSKERRKPRKNGRIPLPPPPDLEKPQNGNDATSTTDDSRISEGDILEDITIEEGEDSLTLEGSAVTEEFMEGGIPDESSKMDMDTSGNSELPAFDPTITSMSTLEVEGMDYVPWFFGCRYSCQICMKVWHYPQACRYHLDSVHKLSRQKYEAQYGSCEVETRLFQCSLCQKSMKCERDIIKYHLEAKHSMSLESYVDHVPNPVVTLGESKRSSAALSRNAVSQVESDTSSSAPSPIPILKVKSGVASPAKLPWYRGSNFVCVPCNRQFSAQVSYISHINGKHNMNLKEYKEFYGSREEVKRYKCRIPGCEQEVSWTYGTISEHLKGHSMSMTEYEKKFHQGTEVRVMTEADKNVVDNQQATGNNLPKEVQQWADSPKRQCKICEAELPAGDNDAITAHLLKVHEAAMEDIQLYLKSEEKKPSAHCCGVCKERVVHRRETLTQHMDRRHSLTLTQYYQAYLTVPTVTITKSGTGKDRKSKGWANGCLYKCALCPGQEFTEEFTLKKHLSLAHSLTVDAYQNNFGSPAVVLKLHTCKVCQASVKHEYTAILNHLRVKHNMTLTAYTQGYMKDSLLEGFEG